MGLRHVVIREDFWMGLWHVVFREEFWTGLWYVVIREDFWISNRTLEIRRFWTGIKSCHRQRGKQGAETKACGN